MKVDLFINLISRYQEEVFDALARTEDLQLNVFSFDDLPKFRRELNPGVKHSGFEFDYEILGRERYKYRGLDCLAKYARLLIALTKSKADVFVLGGYAGFGPWLVLCYAKMMRKPIVLRSGTHINSVSKKGWFHRAIRQIFFRASDAVLAYGSVAAEFAVSNGATSKKIFLEFNTVDTDNLLHLNKNLKPSAVWSQDSMKLKVLFVGQFVPRKQPSVVLEAVREMLSLGYNVELVMVGNGVEYSEILKQKGNNTDDIKIMGALPFESLAAVYRGADVLCVPSTQEVWGLVINEAMCFETSVICSSVCGAAVDIVSKAGQVIHPPVSSVELQKKLTFLIDSPGFLAKSKKYGHEMMQRFSSSNAANSYVKAVRHAIDGGA